MAEKPASDHIQVYAEDYENEEKIRNRQTDDQFENAIRHYQEALKIAESRQDKRQEILACIGISITYRLNNQNEKATVFFKKALNIAEGNNHLDITTYIGLANIYMLDNQFQSATEYFEKALEIAQKRGKKEKESDVYFMLADAHRSSNQYQRAIDCFQKALKISIHEEEKDQEIQAYIGLGDAYKLSNQFEQAIKYLQKALENSKEQGDKEKQFDVCFLLGLTYKSSNQFQMAIEHFEKTLNTSVEQKKASAYLALGDCYASNDQPRKAIMWYEKALETAIQDIEKQQEIWTYTGSKGQSMEANEYLQRASEIAIQPENMIHERQTCIKSVYSYNSNELPVVEHFEKALKMVKEKQNKLKETSASGMLV